MKFAEWLEFLGRVAWLVWDDAQEPMERKYLKLMELMFPVVETEVVDIDEDADITSESDYDDDIASSILRDMYANEVYNGFGELSLKN
jgi:hypothetical protein